MANPIVYGPDYSTYTRTVRMALEEKPVEYELQPVNMLGGETQSAAHLQRQPFGKVPAFEHDGFALYETSAIIRYVDQVFAGRSLQPGNARDAARMNQIIGIIDSYGYGAIILKLVWQRLIVPMTGGQGDESIVSDATPMVRRCLAEIDRIKGGDEFLAGSAVSLADLFLAPVFAYLSMTPDARELLEPHSGLRAWWDAFSKRPSMERTQPKFG
jgi:glutathione S-transferase